MSTGPGELDLDTVVALIRQLGIEAVKPRRMIWAESVQADVTGAITRIHLQGCALYNPPSTPECPHCREFRARQ